MGQGKREVILSVHQLSILDPHLFLCGNVDDE